MERECLLRIWKLILNYDNIINDSMNYQKVSQKSSIHFFLQNGLEQRRRLLPLPDFIKSQIVSFTWKAKRTALTIKSRRWCASMKREHILLTLKPLTAIMVCTIRRSPNDVGHPAAEKLYSHLLPKAAFSRMYLNWVSWKVKELIIMMYLKRLVIWYS